MNHRDQVQKLGKPDGRRLFKSTLIAVGVALVLLVTVVLPSEYGIDPTGVGRLLGLKSMGEIKVQLAEEASQETVSKEGMALEERLTRMERKLDEIAGALANTKVVQKRNAPRQAVSGERRDTISIVLKPGQGTEVKMAMKKGAKAWFEWSANGSKLNCDTHGDGGGQNVAYKKSRGVGKESGTLTAAFTGNHGWFWRNRTRENVTLTLETRGVYDGLKRVK